MVVHPASSRITRVRPYSGTSYRILHLRLRDYYPLWLPFPGVIQLHEIFRCWSPTTPRQVGVWALPVSLATTQGISIDFFSTVTEMFQFAVYPATGLLYSPGALPINREGLPHSEILGSMHACLLAEAYRQLPRPSSESGVKASILYYLLSFLENLHP